MVQKISDEAQRLDDESGDFAKLLKSYGVDDRKVRCCCCSIGALLNKRTIIYASGSKNISVENLPKYATMCEKWIAWAHDGCLGFVFVIDY